MFLITGATGFVGRGLQATLEQRGIEFRAASRDAGSARIAVGNIDGRTDWSAAVAGIDVVVHLASVNQNVVEGSPAALEAYRTVNVEGTMNLARQAAAGGVKRFVLISSIKVHGEYTSKGRPFSVADEPKPQTDYALTKLEAEQQLQALSRETGLELVVIRPPLVYGPGMRGSFDALVRLVRRGIPLPFGSIKNRRSMVYLENLTDLVVAAATHPDAAGATFIAGDGQSPSTSELLRLISTAIGSPMRLVPFPPAALEIAARVFGKQDLVYRLTRSLEADISEAERRLGWLPPFQMSEGLSRTFGVVQGPREHSDG
jgi:nucleoside-diphosphate-sugar epimerase